MTHHLIGAAEAARILGVTRQRVAQLATTPGFPPTEADLSAGRVWSRHAIERWAVEHQAERRTARPEPEVPERFFLQPLLQLAADESERVGSSYVGIEHAIVAMLRPDAPGLARLVLESFGLTLDGARETLASLAGGSHRGMRPWTPALQVASERAGRKALELADPAPSSHHLLLAIIDNRYLGTGLLEGVDPEWIRQRAIALSDVGPREEGPDDAWRERAARAEAWMRATGVKRWEALRPRSDGVDQRSRQPWGSVLFDVIAEPGRPQQYTIDADGVPVVASDGRPIACRVDDDGFLVVDNDGHLVEEPFDLPDGAELEWPPGFTLPPA